MNARLMALLFLSTLSTLANAQADPSGIWEKFHLAVANADRAAAAVVLAVDVQILGSGFVERSRDEYLTRHFDADATFAKAVPRKVIRHSEQTPGSVALVLEETETNGNFEGQPIKLIGTETAVLRLDGGTWRVVHIHWSSRKPKP